MRPFSSVFRWCAFVLVAIALRLPQSNFAEEGTAVLVSSASGPLRGVISDPKPLPGQRRWQIMTKNLNGHVGSVAWSPDGQWLALAAGHSVRLYDFKNEPELQKVLIGHEGFVHAVRFSPDGKWIATASQDGTVRIWDDAGRETFAYRGHEDGVQDVSWHPDGNRLATASSDGTVRIWSRDGTAESVLTDHEAPVRAVAWNPDGKLLASGCLNKVIRFWSAEGTPGPIAEGHLGAISSIAWNSDGTTLLSGDEGYEPTDSNNETFAHMKTWDRTGKPLNSVAVDNTISQVCWSPDGTQALAGGFFSTWLWSASEDKPVRRMGGAGNFTPVAWRPNGEFIAIGGRIQRADGTTITTLPRRVADAAAIDQSPDGSIIAIGCVDGRVHLFDSDGKERHVSESVNAAQMPSSLQAVVDLKWSPDGLTFLATSRFSDQLQQFDVEGKKVGDPVKIPVRGTRSLDWSRDGRYVATGGDPKIPLLIDLQTRVVVQLGRQLHGITQVRFTDDDREICSAGFDACMRFWSRDAKAGKVIEALSAPIRGMALTSDRQRIATGHEDNSIRIWSIDGKEEHFMNGHGGFVQALDFSPDNRQLASGSWDQTVRIWKRDGTPANVLRGHEGSVFAVKWTRDGQHVLSGATDGTVRYSNPQSGQADWVVLFGDSAGYVTLDVHGQVKHGDERILENDFVVFADDDQGRLVRTSWADIRAALHGAK